jgi:hypothetical protein
MVQEPRDKVYRFNEGPAAQAERLRKEARGTPAGVKRDALLGRVQFEPASCGSGSTNSAGARWG